MSNMPDRTPVPSGGLTLPANIGISPKEEQAATVRWDTLEKVIETVNSWGFKEAETPKVQCPEITAEMLLTPDINQYSTMYAALLRWVNYSNALLARIKGELLQIQNEMNDITVQTRKRMRKDNELRPNKEKYSEKDIEDEIATSLRFRELKVREQEVTQLKYELDTRCDELGRSMRVVSRNIEVRKEELEAGRSEQNMPGRINRRPDRFGR